MGLTATLRFPSPLIKPDVRNYRIRLSDRLHRQAHGGGQCFLVPGDDNLDTPTFALTYSFLRRVRILFGVARLIANHLHLANFKSMPEVRVLCSAGITQHQCSYDPVRPPSGPPPENDVEAATLAHDGSPPITRFTLSCVPCPLPRRIERVRVSIPSPLMQPSPNGRRVGTRIVTFEACSGFTLVTAHRIAQPPKATFVTRLQPGQLPDQAARQLPDLSTSIRVEPSSTGETRLRGALPI